ncbi:MAG: bifunctional demethylmenaquinone methyltransferase/2-methoxy-6-polyprenyl-1,4-benzoquinol methylase UbiE [bacterium]
MQKNIKQKTTVNKQNFIYKMFNSLAKDYDKMNNIISFGLHSIIKKKALKNVQIKPGMQILDICTGTGDIAILLAKNLNMSCQITGVDFSENMLDIAAKKSNNLKNIRFIKANALNLPFENNSFDISFISFGLRNLEDLKKGLLEMKRITKKEGYIINLDLGKPKNIIGNLFRLYFLNIVPVLGKLFYHNNLNFNPYKYLPESSNDFPSQEKLIYIFNEIGLTEIKNYNFLFGTIAQQVAKL